MTKFTYKLLAGRHVDGGKLNPKTGKRAEENLYMKGDLIHTDTDLHKLFGPSAQFKFELMETAPPPVAAKKKPAVVAEPDPVVDDTEEGDDDWEEYEEEDDDGLDAMTSTQLKVYAKEASIDLGHAKKKADMVAAIRDELALRAE